MDPWAAWVLHALSTYRKLHSTNPDLATKVFTQAKKVKPHAFRLKHGAARVTAILIYWRVANTFSKEIWNAQFDVPCS